MSLIQFLKLSAKFMKIVDKGRAYCEKKFFAKTSFIDVWKILEAVFALEYFPKTHTGIMIFISQWKFFFIWALDYISIIFFAKSIFKILPGWLFLDVFLSSI